MKHFYLPKSFVVLTLFFLGSSLFAQSGKVSIQGILKNFNGTVATDGPYDMEFKIYTSPTGGAAIWTETQSGINAVEVSGGVYNTALGKTPAGLSALQTLPFDVPYYVGIKVLTGANPLEMTPRIELAYAVNTLHADYADTAQVAIYATLAYGVAFTGGSGISENPNGNLELLAATTNDNVVIAQGDLEVDTVHADFVKGELNNVVTYSNAPITGIDISKSYIGYDGTPRYPTHFSSAQVPGWTNIVPGEERIVSGVVPSFTVPVEWEVNVQFWHPATGNIYVKNGGFAGASFDVEYQSAFHYHQGNLYIKNNGTCDIISFHFKAVYDNPVD